MGEKEANPVDKSDKFKETPFYKGIIESAPPPQCEAWVQSAGYESRKQKKALMLRALYVRAYPREDGKAHLFFYQTQDGMEPDYILDLNALKSVKRHFTKKKAPEQAVTYLLKFRSGHRIRTRFRRVKAVDHAMRFNVECAPEWDRVLLNKSVPKNSERRRDRLAMKSKLKSILHLSTFHRFHRKKKAKARDEAEVEKIKKHLQKEQDTLGIVTYYEDDVAAQLISSTSCLSSFDMDTLNMDEDCVAQQPMSTNKPKLASTMDTMSCSITKEFDEPAGGVDEKTGGKIVEGFTWKMDEFEKEGLEEGVDVLEVQFESGAESDPNSQTSCSSGEIESEIMMLDNYCIAPTVQTEPLAGPPFTSFSRLLNTPQEERFSTWPTTEEFQILLEFERLMDSGEVDAENDWENKLDTATIRIYTKKLPATVSSATLVSAQFVDINAPPEVIYTLIHNRPDRLQWDENIKSLTTMEGPDEQGRDIEYCVCKAPMGFSNREFLKYRICNAEFQKYPYMMLMRSCERDEWPVGRGNVRAESTINGYVIRPEKDDPWKTRISIVANTEIKGLIPTWTVNAMASRLPPRWVSALEAAAIKYMADNKITRETNLAQLFH
eukprot:GEMP01004613.1.p1 GENE.GEMP01004613.1~~GEMP01004613.1.p1  ORF type:complete len:636 (+),score=107.46 GEMP01004613.1:88-1908(+)